ncbi:MAG: hypothetical protein IPL55_09845 [Saprospiraceae bacterium]|nr:hypothetical protein [Saprospiraceae bacterium]
MHKIQTYCQVKFLEVFFNNIPEVSLSEMISGSENSKIYIELSSFLYSKACISVDSIAQILSLAQNGNPFFKKLIKASTSGGSEIIDYSKFFNNLLTELQVALNTPANSVHMYYQQNTVLSNSKFGWLTLDNENWQSRFGHLSIKKSYKVDRNNALNQFTGWSVLSSIELPINAAVIVDNYILDKPDHYKNNIFELMRNLLPEGLDHLDFDLAIITKRDLVNPKGKLEILNNFIQNLQLSYSVKITIYCTPADNPHDRDILTNYYRIHSGHSLDYYNKNGNIIKDTTLQIIGLTGEENNPHNLILRNIANVASRGKLDFDMYGDGNNRLFQM